MWRPLSAFWIRMDERFALKISRENGSSSTFIFVEWRGCSGKIPSFRVVSLTLGVNGSCDESCNRMKAKPSPLLIKNYKSNKDIIPHITCTVHCR